MFLWFIEVGSRWPVCLSALEALVGFSLLLLLVGWFWANSSVRGKSCPSSLEPLVLSRLRRDKTCVPFDSAMAWSSLEANISQYCTNQLLVCPLRATPCLPCLPAEKHHFLSADRPLPLPNIENKPTNLTTAVS